MRPDRRRSNGVKTTSPAETLATDASDAPVSKAIGGLKAETTYYFRAFVTRVGLSTPYSPLKKVVVT